VNFCKRIVAFTFEKNAF